MIPFNWSTWPLAEIGDNFPDSGPRLNWSDLWAYWIALVVGAAITGIVMFARRRNDMTVHCNNSWKLFRELEPKLVVTDCPLSALRILKENDAEAIHPAEALARAYGLKLEI